MPNSAKDDAIDQIEQSGKIFQLMIENFSRLLPIPHGAELERANESILKLVVYGQDNKFRPVGEFTSEQDAFAEIFRWYIEAETVRHRFRDYEKMIKRSPFKVIGISAEAYFRFVITGYLNDVYALHERLKGYLNVIGKLYGKRTRESEEIKHCYAVCAQLKKSSLIDARGQHTHALTFSDGEMKRLGMIKLLALSDDFKELEKVHPEAVRAFKKKWITIMNSWNPAISKAAIQIYQLSSSVLFDGNLFKAPIPSRP